MLIGAFHDNVWFDESYSVALASHGFSEIWRIGAGDVHPVLFYWALHCLFLLFGQNVLVYRLFALAGAVALGALGLSHVRRDFGWRCGTVFTFLALFTPYVAVMAIEIRMYSWATFAVMLCFLSAWRIFQRSRAGVSAGWRSWTVFFLSSLASAYLHYFGAIAAFMVNACLLTALVWLMRQQRRADNAKCTGRKYASCKCTGRALAIFAGSALVQLALYAPWLSAVASQMGVVSQTYWANIVFPTTFIELAVYPFFTSQFAFALRGGYGLGWQIGFQVVTIAALVLLAVILISALTPLRRRAKGIQNEKSHNTPILTASEACSAMSHTACRADVHAAIAALIVYLGTVAIAWIASFAMGSFMVYYRYLFVVIGPLLFAISVGLTHLRRPVFRVAALVLVFVLSLMTQYLLCSDNYDPQNKVPLERFAQTVQDLSSDREIGQEASQGTDQDADQGIDQESNQGAGQGTDPGADQGASQRINQGASRGADQGTSQGADQEINQGTTPLVVSSDIGIMGVTSVEFPDIAQTYLDWQKGNWALSYEAYAPTMTSVKSWELMLDGYEGDFIVLGQSSKPTTARDVVDLAQKQNVELLSEETFYRPYERTYFTVAHMRKIDGAPLS